MHTEITRLMIEIAVTRALQQLRFGDSKRALRQLVEFGLRYSHSDFSVRLFTMLNDMLHNTTHPYYEAFRELVLHVDSRYLLEYGINLGYDSWAAFRKRRSQLGSECKTWYAVIYLDQLQADPAAYMQQYFQQGIYAFILYTERPDADLLQSLCAAFPQCALTLFVPDSKVTPQLLDDLEGTTTLAIAICRQHGSFQAIDTLKEHRRLYFLCRQLDASDLAQILSSGKLPKEESVLICYLLDKEVSSPSAMCFSALVHEQLKMPMQPLVPVFLPDDLFRVEQILGITPVAALPNA